MQVATDKTITSAPTCNVCGGSVFEPFRRRPAARCSACGSMERTRILKFILDEERLIRSGQRVLHLAPEPGIGRHIKEVVGAGYDARDLNPQIYPTDLGVVKFDLISDTISLPAERYDLILHSHVLEHIPGDIISIMFFLHRALKSGGKHIFCVPILPGKYEADFGNLSREERTRRFGQFDHVRKFGVEDFYSVFGMAFFLRPYQLQSHMFARMQQHSIPEGTASNLDSNTYFVMDKSDIKLK